MLLSVALTNEKVEKLDCAWVFHVGFGEGDEEEESFKTACSHISVPSPSGHSHHVRQDVCTQTHPRAMEEAALSSLSTAGQTSNSVLHRASHPTQPDKAHRLGYKAKQVFVMYRVCIAPKGVT